MIRRFQIGDEFNIRAIFHDAIFELAASDYTPTQLAAWANTAVRDEGYWRTRCATIKPYVMDQEGRVVGFLEMDSTGQIKCAYVRPADSKLGIMSDLLEEAMRHALKNRIKRLRVEASITSAPFFELHGFQWVRDDEVVIDGVSMKVFIMETHLDKYFEGR